MPRNVIEVDGPSIFEDFTRALMYLQSDNMESRLQWQLGDSAVRKSSR